MVVSAIFVRSELGWWTKRAPPWATGEARRWCSGRVGGVSDVLTQIVVESAPDLGHGLGGPREGAGGLPGVRGPVLPDRGEDGLAEERQGVGVGGEGSPALL